jgi:hypothetical protein
VAGEGGHLLAEGACAVIAIGATATALWRMVVIHQRLRRQEQGEAQGGPAR